MEAFTATQGTCRTPLSSLRTALGSALLQQNSAAPQRAVTFLLVCVFRIYNKNAEKHVKTASRDQLHNSVQSKFKLLSNLFSLKVIAAVWHQMVSMG